MQKITPFLWFNDQAEEAMLFYTSIFKHSKVGSVTRYEEGWPGPVGKVMSVNFQLEGLEFIGLNGGPAFAFSSAISFYVDCKTQEEVDDLWDPLSEGGETLQCGWLKDKFGITWQIIPSVLFELLHDEDAEKSKRVMQAMMKMVKIDIAGLKQAYQG